MWVPHQHDLSTQDSHVLPVELDRDPEPPCNRIQSGRTSFENAEPQGGGEYLISFRTVGNMRLRLDFEKGLQEKKERNGLFFRKMRGSTAAKVGMLH